MIDMNFSILKDRNISKSSEIAAAENDHNILLSDLPDQGNHEYQSVYIHTARYDEG